MLSIVLGLKSLFISRLHYQAAAALRLHSYFSQPKPLLLCNHAVTVTILHHSHWHEIFLEEHGKSPILVLFWSGLGASGILPMRLSVTRVSEVTCRSRR